MGYVSKVKNQNGIKLLNSIVETQRDGKAVERIQ